MKKFALLSLLICLNTHAEFAQIQDPDGHTNLRKEPNAQSHILSKIPNGTYVYTPEGDGDAYKKGNWVSSYYIHNNKLVGGSGWIHQSRLHFIHHNAAIPIQTNQNGFSCLKNGMGVQVTMGKFDFAAHKNQFTKIYLIYNDYSSGYLSHYRGKPMYGTDGGEPITHFRDIRFIYNGKTIVVPPEKYEFLFNPYFETPDESRPTHCYYRAKDDTFFLTTVIGDGAAYTEVLFVFQQGSLKTVLASLHPEV